MSDSFDSLNNEKISADLEEHQEEESKEEKEATTTKKIIKPIQVCKRAPLVKKYPLSDNETEDEKNIQQSAISKPVLKNNARLARERSFYDLRSLNKKR